ncbi:hypothetical protein BH24GEM3_BH24GEM3_22770 [soil metagenome]
MPSRQEREELRDRLDEWFEIPLILAAITLVILLLVDATRTLEPPWDTYLEWISLLIWGVFALEFGLRLWLSPDRSRYLREHWLDALAVALPPFRILRGLRAVQVLVYSSRGASEFLDRLGRRRLGMLAVISLFVVLAGSALLFLVESGQAQSPIRSFGDALFWTTMAVLASEGGLEITTTWGRLILIALVAYSVVVFSYLVGAVASLWVESDLERRGAEAVRTEESPGMERS